MQKCVAESIFFLFLDAIQPHCQFTTGLVDMIDLSVSKREFEKQKQKPEYREHKWIKEYVYSLLTIFYNPRAIILLLSSIPVAAPVNMRNQKQKKGLSYSH